MLISKDLKIQKDINKLRFIWPKYKALAIAYHEENGYAYWYTYEMYSQKIANKMALKNCNEASEKLRIEKECRLYNELINDINY
jgi:hypothetical protein